MAHITLSQLTTVLQRIVSWATGKFAAKNTYSGKIEYTDMPVVVLASMGSELDGTSAQRPMSAGSTYYLPAGQGAGARIMFVDSNGTAVKISNPESNVIYCNAYTGLLYRWDASESDMVPVGGDVDGLSKVYVDNSDFSSLDTIYSGVYQVIDQTTQRIIGVLVASSDGRIGVNPYFVTQWLFSNLLLSDEYSGSFNGYYTIGRAHIIHRFYNASNTSYSDIPLNTWSEWKVYGITLDEMSEIFNSKVSSISVNGTNHTPDSNGVVDLGTIQGAQGPKGDTGNVQVDGNGNVLIVNNLEEGGTGAALSAEMGKRLALLAGTYAGAWARSKVITVPFCWLWVETVNGAAISKPIWHKGNSVFVDATGAIINVPAAAVPAAPTITGATSGSTVPKNTQITITPASGSALYYSIDGGSTYHTSDSAVTLTLATAGSVSIVAYCANNAGNSSNATLSVTVAGTAVPSFSQPSGEVARGGSVAISVPAGGELHYKVGSGAWQTASGNSVSVPITGATTIQAYNVQDGDTSSTITNNYTMAALASPTFSVATGTEFPATGGSVELTGPAGATIYYTTDGSTPTTSSTQYAGTAIAVTSAMTIKAIAHDIYGYSAVAEASYRVVQPKIIVTATDATTMSLGETGLTELTINAGTNEFTPADLGITTFADHVFPSLSFGDNTKIITFDGGGLQVNSLDDVFSALGGSNPTLTKCVGIVLAGQDAHAKNAFRNCTYLTECELSGVVNGLMTGAFAPSTGNRLTALDISGLSGHVTDCSSMFFSVGCEVIDVSQLTFTKDKAASMFRNCLGLKTIKVGKLEMETATLINLMFLGTSGVTTVICTETTPYTTGWLDKLNGQHALTAIYVPDASVNDYKAHSEWGTYASIIQGISNYTE